MALPDEIASVMIYFRCSAREAQDLYFSVPAIEWYAFVRDARAADVKERD